MFKQLEVLKEDEIEKEYVPYVIQMLKSEVFTNAEILEAIKAYLLTFPDLVIDVPKLTLNFGTIIANLLAQNVIDGSQLTFVNESA